MSERLCCEKCGAEISCSDKFCTRCGSAISSVTSEKLVLKEPGEASLASFNRFMKVVWWSFALGVLSTILDWCDVRGDGHVIWFLLCCVAIFLDFVLAVGIQKGKSWARKVYIVFGFVLGALVVLPLVVGRLFAFLPSSACSAAMDDVVSHSSLSFFVDVVVAAIMLCGAIYGCKKSVKEYFLPNSLAVGMAKVRNGQQCKVFLITYVAVQICLACFDPHDDATDPTDDRYDHTSNISHREYNKGSNNDNWRAESDSSSRQTWDDAKEALRNPAALRVTGRTISVLGSEEARPFWAKFWLKLIKFGKKVVLGLLVLLGVPFALKKDKNG